MGLVLLACDGHEHGDDDVAVMVASMRDGTEAPTRLVLDDYEHRALGAFVVDGGVRCTAALIEVGRDARFAVTARHCFEREPDLTMVRFVSAASLGQGDLAGVALARVHLHPEVDVAIVELATPIRDAYPFEVAEASVDGLVGDVLEVAGAGLGSGGGMRFGVFEVVAVTATRIEVESELSGQCAGDSGGPWFRVDDGLGEIVAVASTSATSCGNPAFGVRLDELTHWIAEVTLEPVALAPAQHVGEIVEPAPHGEGCSGGGPSWAALGGWCLSLLLGFAPTRSAASLRHRRRECSSCRGPWDP